MLRVISALVGACVIGAVAQFGVYKTTVYEPILGLGAAVGVSAVVAWTYAVIRNNDLLSFRLNTERRAVQNLCGGWLFISLSCILLTQLVRGQPFIANNPLAILLAFVLTAGIGAALVGYAAAKLAREPRSYA